MLNTFGNNHFASFVLIFCSVFGPVNHLNLEKCQTGLLEEVDEIIKREIELKEVIKKYIEEDERIPQKYLEMIEEKGEVLRKMNLWVLEKEELEELGEKIETELAKRGAIRILAEDKE